MKDRFYLLSGPKTALIIPSPLRVILDIGDWWMYDRRSILAGLVLIFSKRQLYFVMNNFPNYY